MQSYKKIAQIVDTIKLHFYHSEDCTSRELLDYTKTVSMLSDLKDEAYSIKHANNDMRYVNHQFGMDRFRVMATTVRGFSVTLQNNDVSISLKSVSKKVLPEQFPENYDYSQKVETPIQPVIRAEFRASFLARVGHENAINYVIKLVERFLIKSYNIKISEIHLATDVQGYNFHHLDYQRFKTRKQQSKEHKDGGSVDHTFYWNGRTFTGFSIGSGDDMLRIYNKTKEIKKFPDKDFVKMLVWEHNKDYDPYAEVWRIEVQYRREKLKTMYDSKNGLLDGFENILASIPSLWNKALENVEMLDFNDEICLQHYLGYTLDSLGVKIPILYEAVKSRIRRAFTHPLWIFLKGWKGLAHGVIKPHEAPKTASFQWVSNSIKSFLSTLYKHAGDLSPKIIEDAFLRAQEETIRDKQMTLVDNAVNNTLDYLGDVIRYTESTGVTGYVERDSFSTLQKNLSMYVREVTINLFDVQGTHDDFSASRARILNKSLARMVI